MEFTLTEILLTVLNLVLLGGGWFIISFLKKMPDLVYNRSLKSFQHNLDKQLTGIKAELSKELELLKIARSDIQSNKREQFMKFNELFMKTLIDPKYRKSGSLKKDITDIGSKLFFFSSDDTIKKFIKIREVSKKAESDPTAALYWLAELTISMRKDLGYADTSLTVDDYCNILLKDWNEYKAAN